MYLKFHDHCPTFFPEDPALLEQISFIVFKEVNDPTEELDTKNYFKSNGIYTGFLPAKC